MLLRHKGDVSSYVICCFACVVLICGCSRPGPPVPLVYSNGGHPDLVIHLEKGGRAVVDSVPIGISDDCVELRSETHDLLSDGEAEWRNDGQRIEIWGDDWSLRGYFASATIGIDWGELKLDSCDGDALVLFERE